MLCINAKKGTGLDDLFKEYVPQQLEEQTIIPKSTSTIQSVLDQFHDLLTHPPPDHQGGNPFYYHRAYRLPMQDILTPQEISTFTQMVSCNYDSLETLAWKDIFLQRFLHALIMNSFEAGFNNFTLDGKDIPYISFMKNNGWDNLLGDPLAFSHSLFYGSLHASPPRNLMLTINGDRQFSTIRADYAHYSLHGSRQKIFIHGGHHVSLEVHGEISGECSPIPGRTGDSSTYSFYAPVRSFHFGEEYYQHCRFNVSTEENYNTLLHNIHGERNIITLIDANTNVIKQQEVGEK